MASAENNSVHLSEELHSSRKFLKSVFDRIPGMIYVHDLINDVNLYRSWSLKRILGYEESDVLNSGKGIRDLVHEDDLGEFRRAAEELQEVEDNEGVRFSYRMLHNDGHWIWFRSEEYVYERANDGKPTRVLGYVTDLTSTYEQQQKLDELNKVNSFLLKAARILSQPTKEPTQTLQELAKELSKYFEAVCDISLLDSETDTIKPKALYHSDKKVRSIINKVFADAELKRGEGFVGSVVETGKEILIKEVPDHMKKTVAQLDSRIIPGSMMYVPIKGSNSVLGSLNLTRLDGQTEFSDNDAKQIRHLGEYLSLFIENQLLHDTQKREIELRKRAEAKLERSGKMLERMEAETRAMLNAIPIYISRVSKDLRYLFLNDHYKNLGTDPRSLEGRFTVDVITEQGLKKIRPYYNRVLSGELVNYEYDGVMADGKHHYFSVALAPDRTEEGEVVGFYSCATDITSKVLAEQEAERTQDRFESLSLNSGDAFFFHDEDQNILDVNEVATEMLGYSRAEFLKMKAADIDPRWKKNVYQQYLKELGVNAPQTFDTIVFKKGGAELPVEVRFVKRVEEGKTYIQSLIRDRTEKREQEERLQRSEQHLRLIFDNVEDFIATIKEDGTIESVNKTSQGIKPEDVIGGSVFDWYPDKTIRNSVERGFEELRASGKGFDVETTNFTGPDGSVRTYFNKYIGIFQDGKLLKAILIIRDITEERNEERAVMNAVLKGQEQERKRLGAELHDGIGQVLSALVLQVSQIHQAVSKEEKDSVQQEITTLKQNLQGAIKEVRNISHDLMPDVLDSLGLLEALKQTCANLQERSGMQVRFNHIDVEPRYDSAVEVNLFRITQELLNNVQKHAESGSVFVSLMDHGDILSLTIEDDGVGFDRTVVTNGIGLKNVKSRVNMINGEIDVESAKNSGTLVNIEVPKTLT